MLPIKPPTSEEVNVKVLANEVYPEAFGTLTPSLFPGFGNVRVIGGEYAGKVWCVPFTYLELLTDPDSLMEAGTPNSLPNCQVGVKASSNNDSVNAYESDITRVMPSIDDEPPTPDVKIFTPGLTPERLRKQLGVKVGKTETPPKGFKHPILRSQKLDALKRVEEHLNANAQEVQKGLYAHLDWLQGTGVVSHPQKVLPFFADVLGEPVLFEPSRQWVMGKTWVSSGRCVNGFKIGFSPRKNEDGSVCWEVLVVFPGSLLSSKPVRHWWNMCHRLRKIMNFKASRFDAALDDLEKELDPEKIKAAILAGNVRGFSAKGCVFTDDSNGGWNIRMGGAGSESSLNIYNKESESDGELPSFRLEARLRRSLAEQALTEWLSIGVKHFDLKSPQKLAGLVIGRYDFIDRASMPNEKHLDRIPRIDWWQRFIDRVNVKPIRHARIRPDWSVARQIKWMRHQIMSPLAVVRKAVGFDVFWSWLDAELDEAEVNKLKPWHWHRVQKFKDEIGALCSV